MYIVKERKNEEELKMKTYKNEKFAVVVKDDKTFVVTNAGVDYKGYIADNGYLRGNTSVDLAVAVKANKQLNFSGRK